jgi:16S rRNA (uracil1498-N3)-methyltransferase
MPAPRFYCPQRLGPGQQLDLPPDAAHHAARVLRLAVGDAVTLFNGEGGEYPAALTHIGKNNVTAKTGPWLGRDSESPLEVRLAQAVSAGDKMDFTLQKAVELGIRAIQPLLAERCVVKLAGERAEKRTQHWQGVVVAACEQSGRNFVPAVAPLQTLPNWLAARGPEGLGLLLSPFAESSLSDLAPPAGPVTLLIGPEGGFSDNEVKMAASRGFTPVRLGARVLRTETAALAALAAMQALWGDF